MENQVARKSNSSAHEGHVCHKCGWVYPNPHPSAKHRRAHKRICGTIQGCKVGNADEKKTRLKGCDDEQHPVVEQLLQTPTPSVKMVESSRRRSGSGFGSRSSARSEDEVFADAATEFSDSPGVGEVYDAIKEPLTPSKKISGENVSDLDPIAVDASAGDFCSINTTADNSQESLIHRSNKDNLVASVALHTETGEDTVVENVTESLVSSEPDVDEKDIVHVVLSNMLDSHLKEIEGVNRSATLDADANENNGVYPSENDPEHETLFPDATPEVYGSIGENASGETAGFLSADVSIEMTRDSSASLNDRNAVVNPIEESSYPLESSTLLENASGEVDKSAEMADIRDKVTEKDNADFQTLKVSEDLPLREELDNLRDFKDHGPIKFCITSVFDDSQVIGSQFSEDDAMVQSQSADQNKEPESTVCPKNGTDVRLAEHPQGVDNNEPIVEGLLVERSSQESVTKDVEVSNNCEIIQALPTSCSLEQNHLELPGSSSLNVLPIGAALVGCDNQGVHSARKFNNNEEAKNDDVIGAASSSVAGDESDVTLAIAISSESLDAEALSEKTISSIERGNEHDHENTSTKNVGSRDALDAGSSSDCALLSPEFHEETYIQQELDAIAENIPLVQTTSLRDRDDASVCQNASARIVESMSQELTDGENEALGEISTPTISYDPHGERNGGINCESQNLHIPAESFSNHAIFSNALENPLHATNLVETQDGGENVQISDDKVVGVESVSPVDTSYTQHQGTNIVLDTSPISTNCARLNSSPRTAENHGEEVLEDGVGIIQIVTVEECSAKELTHDISGVPDKSLRAEVDDDVSLPAVDALVDCSSQTDSLEANWGSISDVEAILSSDSRATTEKQTGTLTPSMPVVQQFDKPEVYDAPSFMTLVEPKARNVGNEDAFETQASKIPEPDGSSSLQAGWFPSVAHAASESPGRKRNEEIIAKVTNWSTSKQQHSALKSLLGEAQDGAKENPPSPKDKEGIPVTKTDDLGTNVLGPRQQQTISQAVEAAAAKEWNSPARYPSNIKRRKGKSKSRSYWSPFICCSSVQSS